MPIWCFLAGVLPAGQPATPEEMFLLPFLSAHAWTERMGGTGLTSVHVDGIGLASTPLAPWG